MGENTKVEYVKHSFSPWWGCSRKSRGCKACFAADNARRWGHSDLWHLHGPRRVVSDDQWRKPLKWNREAEQEGVRARILCGTMCDVFEDHPAVPGARARLFDLVAATPWLLWLFFTKRPENVNDLVPWGDDWPDNTGLIASTEDQNAVDERVPLVLSTAAPLKGLSVEPLVGPATLSMCSWAPPGGEGLAGVHNPLTGEWWPAVGDCAEEYAGRRTDQARLDWIIVGGESGRKASPMHPRWVSDLYRECQDSNVPMWLKQWGEWAPVVGGTGGDAWTHPDRHVWVDPRTGKTKPFGAFTGGDDMDWAHMRRAGKGAAGHLLDGREIEELPAAAYLIPGGRHAA